MKKHNASKSMLKIDESREVNAIIDKVREKLRECGFGTFVTTNTLPGSGKSIALFVADSTYALHAGLVALEEGKNEAYCDIATFANKVEFHIAESPIAGVSFQARRQKRGSPNRSVSTNPKNHCKKWCQSDYDALVDTWESDGPGNTLAAIAEKMNRNEAGVAAKLVRLGLVGSRDEARLISGQRAAANGFEHDSF